MSKGKNLKSLKELGILLNEDEKAEIQAKDEYQESWRINKYQFREMIAKKNRAWLLEQAKEATFEYYKEYSDVYEKIVNMFEDEKKRKWIIHIITNFLPINRAVKVPKMPSNKHICPFTGFELTDTSSLMTGDRDKHLGFTGEKTNVIMSGIALQELERFVLYCTEEFDTREGHIVNYALDQVRIKNKKNGK